MKRLVGILFTAIVLYSIYFDLSHGTLPSAITKDQSTTANANANTDKNEQSTVFEREVKTGDTVLSIIEDELNQSISVPITEVISDFTELNNGVTPQEIQPGKSYKFPNYKEEQ